MSKKEARITTTYDQAFRKFKINSVKYKLWLQEVLS